MEARLKLTVKSGRTFDLVLNGPPKAIEDRVERLRAMAGRGTTVHRVVDTERVAS